MREYEERGIGDDWNVSTRITYDDNLFWDYSEGAGPFSDKTLMETLHNYDFRQLQTPTDKSDWNRSTKVEASIESMKPVVEQSPQATPVQTPSKAKVLDALCYSLSLLFSFLFVCLFVSSFLG